MSRTKRGYAVTCIYAAIDLSVHPYSSQRTARKGSDTDDTCMCPATLSVWAEIWIGQMHQLRQTQSKNCYALISQPHQNQASGVGLSLVRFGPLGFGGFLGGR